MACILVHCETSFLLCLATEENTIFGVPLEVATERNRSHDGISLPVIVRQCIDYIEEQGLMQVRA